MSSLKFPTFPVLIVDDEKHVLDTLSNTLKSNRINNVIGCQDSRQVMEILSRQEIEVLLLDLTMPHISGQELLSIIRQEYPEISVIIITGATEVCTAVECMKMGVFDYLVKVVESRKLVATVSRAIEIRELKRENRSLKQHLFSNELRHPDAFSGILSNNKTIRSIFMYIESISNTSHPVLITGETGVGKELVAQAIHSLSGGRGDFNAVNIAGFDDNMFSDALFGHEKGAYTGAEQPRKGLLENASEGTLFLDEIGELSNQSQVKLLRLLETGEYSPLGSDMVKRLKARVIVATNRDLTEIMAKGAFRKDLYYRLNTHHIHIPPLRKRKDDLPLLINHFLKQASDELGKKVPAPPPELYVLLGTYHFPGNVRELKSMIFDAVSRHRSGTLSLEVFKLAIGENEVNVRTDIHKPSVTFSEKLPTLGQMSWILIEEAIKRAKGNRSIAAGLLGITPQALGKRLNRAGK